MQKNLISASLLLATVFVAGCTSPLDGLKNAGNSLTDLTDAASGKMSELEYYNLVIEKTNDIQDDIDSYGDGYDSYLSFKEETTCNYSTPLFVEDSYNDAKKELIDTTITMEDADKQAKVEEQLLPFLDLYAALNTYTTEFEDYCAREQYKDDGGAKITEYEDGLVSQLDNLSIQHNTLLDIVEDYQKGVDLGIDANTTKPDEVAILIQNELTDRIQAFYEDAFTPYAQAVADGTAADFTPVKTSYDDLVADIATQQKRGEDVGLTSDAILSGSYNNYITQVNAISIEGEKLVRDQANGAITTENIYDYDDALLNAYNAVIDAHNGIVQALDSYVQL